MAGDAPVDVDVLTPLINEIKDTLSGAIQGPIKLCRAEEVKLATADSPDGIAQVTKQELARLVSDLSHVRNAKLSAFDGVSVLMSTVIAHIEGRSWVSCPDRIAIWRRRIVR